jgi:hypothetical protein
MAFAIQKSFAAVPGIYGQSGIVSASRYRTQSRDAYAPEINLHSFAQCTCNIQPWFKKDSERCRGPRCRTADTTPPGDRLRLRISSSLPVPPFLECIGHHLSREDGSWACCMFDIEGFRCRHAVSVAASFGCNQVACDK